MEDSSADRTPAVLKAPNLRARMAHPNRTREGGVPIYEYECQGCQRRLSLLIRTFAAAEGPRCPRCGSSELSRLMSRFATVKSEDARLDALSDPSSYGNLDENDPRSVARWMKKMGGAMGDEAGEDWDEMVDEATEQEAGPAGDGDPSETSGDADSL